MSGTTSKQVKLDEAEMQKAFEVIDDVQNEIDRLNEQASEEILQVEQKYNKLRQPNYRKRSDLISKIPSFWISVFLNHPQLSSRLDQHDETILQYLKRIDVEEHDDIKSGYRIKFTFDSNPFFDNDLIIKEFSITESSETQCKSTPIRWKNETKNGQTATGSSTTKKHDGDTSASSTRKRAHDHEISNEHGAFMTWFMDTTGEVGNDEFGEVIKDDIFINPLQYYLAATTNDEEEGSAGENDDDDDLEEKDDEQP